MTLLQSFLSFSHLSNRQAIRLSFAPMKKLLLTVLVFFFIAKSTTLSNSKELDVDNLKSIALRSVNIETANGKGKKKIIGKKSRKASKDRRKRKKKEERKISNKKKNKSDSKKSKRKSRKRKNEGKVNGHAKKRKNKGKGRARKRKNKEKGNAIKKKLTKQNKKERKREKETIRQTEQFDVCFPKIFEYTSTLRKAKTIQKQFKRIVGDKKIITNKKDKVSDTY